MHTIDLDVRKPCPACGGAFRKAPQATPQQRAKAVSTSLTYEPLPPHFDTAPLDVIEELGELWRCAECGNPHRVKPTPAPAASTAGN